MVAAAVTNKHLAHHLLTDIATARVHVDQVCTLSDEEWDYVVAAVARTNTHDILVFAEQLYTVLHAE